MVVMPLSTATIQDTPAEGLMVSFRLLGLPSELVELVSEHLHDDSLCSIRQSSRSLYTHSLAAFGKRFFKEVTAILHPLSLGVLLEIARHPALFKWVRKLTISGERVGLTIDTCVESKSRLLKMHKKQKFKSQKSILREVFQKLARLETIRIDNLSYYITPKGLRCGVMGIIPEGFQWDCMKADSEHRCKNHAFGVVLSTIKHLPASDSIQWEFEVYINEEPVEPSEGIHLRTKLWKQNVAEKVRRLEISAGDSFLWVQDLLQSTSHLEELDLFCGDLHNFCHPTLGPLFWPRLRNLQLKDGFVEQRSITSLLLHHQATLTHLFLNGIEMTDGSWRAPLRIMACMSQLEDIHLSALGENSPDLTECASWPDALAAFPRLELGIQCHERAKVGTALHTLVSYFRVKSTRFGNYRVNFRLAEAVISGQAELQESKWVLLT